MAFVAKKSLFDIPFLGFAMKYYRCVSIDRGDREKAIKKLNEDCFDRLSINFIQTQIQNILYLVV